MKKASQLERLRSKFLDKEGWDAGSKHAERDLGFIGSAGVFDENGVMLSEPWSDALLFAPALDEAMIAKRQAVSDNRKKDAVINQLLHYSHIAFMFLVLFDETNHVIFSRSVIVLFTRPWCPQNPVTSISTT